MGKDLPRRQENTVVESLGLDFPGGPVVKTLCFYFKGVGSIPGWGTMILYAAWHS